MENKLSVPDDAVEAKLAEQIVDAVYRSMSEAEDGSWWLDNLKANARVKKLLAAALSARPEQPEGSYELGRHDERQRTMQLIGSVRMDSQTGAAGDVLDRLVMSIAAEPLADKRFADMPKRWCAVHQREEFKYESLEHELAEQPEGWQPIETAPKDGHHILVYVPYNKCSFVVYSRAPFPSQTEWRIAGAGIDNYLPEGWEPTHWMPLPNRPAEQPEGDDKEK